MGQIQSHMKRGSPMKTKLFQLYVYFNNLDRRYIQWAYFVYLLAMLVVQGAPEDGGGGTR
jgi:hypothetical protein